MYKVFFNHRAVYFSDDLSKTIDKSKGLLYRCDGDRDLRDVIDRFLTQLHIPSLHILHEDLPVLFEEFKACFRLIDAGGGLVFNPKGEFLVIKRNGVWDLPKGKLEKGEDFETAALREVEEETGLRELVVEQPIMSTYHTYQISNHKVLKRTQWFEMLYSENKEPVLEEREGITKYRWVIPGESEFIKRNTYGSIMDVLKIKDLL